MKVFYGKWIDPHLNYLKPLLTIKVYSMKKVQNLTAYFFILFVLLTITAKGQQVKSDGYLISGTLKGIDSGIIRMSSTTGDSVLDSSIIVKGKFFMQGKIGTPERMLFTISPGNWNFRAFVENSRIKFFIDTAGAEHYGKGSNKWALIWKIKETGSGLCDVYEQYKKETNLQYYSSIFSSLNGKLKAVKGDKVATTRVEHEMDSVKNLVLPRLKSWIENYISQHPSSIAGVYLFNEYYQTSMDSSLSLSYLDSILNRFSGAATSSIYYKQLADKVINLKNIQPNSLAPDFTLQKRDKSTFTLSSTRRNFTLIDFWASWCVPCRKAIPAWKEVYAQYKDKGLVIVSVSNDRDWNEWIKALNNEQMPWIQVIDEFPAEDQPAVVAELYPSITIPFYVLLDKEGKVILASGEEDIMRKKIEEVFR
jgi:thiol-disulfide isomerase/thioredoxin